MTKWVQHRVEITGHAGMIQIPYYWTTDAVYRPVSLTFDFKLFRPGATLVIGRGNKWEVCLSYLMLEPKIDLRGDFLQTYGDKTGLWLLFESKPDFSNMPQLIIDMTVEYSEESNQMKYVILNKNSYRRLAELEEHNHICYVDVYSTRQFMTDRLTMLKFNEDEKVKVTRLDGTLCEHEILAKACKEEYLGITQCPSLHRTRVTPLIDNFYRVYDMDLVMNKDVEFMKVMYYKKK